MLKLVAEVVLFFAAMAVVAAWLVVLAPAEPWPDRTVLCSLAGRTDCR